MPVESIMPRRYKNGSDRTDADYFVTLYCLVAWYFSQKMIRLVLLLGPASACVAGIALARITEWCYEKLIEDQPCDASTDALCCTSIF